MMMQRVMIMSLVVIGLLAGVAAGHPGGTDQYGCHRCRTNCEQYGLEYGEYHCHRTSSQRSSAGSVWPRRERRRIDPEQLAKTHREMMLTVIYYKIKEGEPLREDEAALFAEFDEDFRALEAHLFLEGNGYYIGLRPDVTPAPLPPVTEREFQEAWCAQHEGETEALLLNGGRADCLTAAYAVEVEFAEHWREAVGQALDYALGLGRKPGIVLILREAWDRRYVEDLEAVLAAYGLEVRVWTVTGE